MTAWTGRRVRRAMTLTERLAFYSKTNAATGCTEWLGSTDGKLGYGKLRWDGRMQYVHRLAYGLAFGAIADGLVVRHTCDNPACLNPDHLLVGTQQENVADQFARNRAARMRGASHRLAALTNAQCAEIRQRYRKGSRANGQSALAREFNTTQTTVWRVVHHLSYKES